MTMQHPDQLADAAVTGCTRRGRRLNRPRKQSESLSQRSFRFHFADYECRAGKATNEANRLQRIDRLYNVLKERRKLSLVELSILKQAETLSLEKSSTC